MCAICRHFLRIFRHLNAFLFHRFNSKANVLAQLPYWKLKLRSWRTKREQIFIYKNYSECVTSCDLANTEPSIICQSYLAYSWVMQSTIQLTPSEEIKCSIPQSIKYLKQPPGKEGNKDHMPWSQFYNRHSASRNREYTGTHLKLDCLKMPLITQKIYLKIQSCY